MAAAAAPERAALPSRCTPAPRPIIQRPAVASQVLVVPGGQHLCRGARRQLSGHHAREQAVQHPAHPGVLAQPIQHRLLRSHPGHAPPLLAPQLRGAAQGWGAVGQRAPSRAKWRTCCCSSAARLACRPVASAGTPCIRAPAPARRCLPSLPETLPAPPAACPRPRRCAPTSSAPQAARSAGAGGGSAGWSGRRRRRARRPPWWRHRPVGRWVADGLVEGWA